MRLAARDLKHADVGKARSLARLAEAYAEFDRIANRVVALALGGIQLLRRSLDPAEREAVACIQADALKVDEHDLWDIEREFVAIHASPPCQLFSAYQRANKRQGEHLNLIPETRELLRASGLPYVIENVPGAPLEDPVVICGSSVGLWVRRHRVFETSFPVVVPPCACGGWQEARFDRGSRDIRPNDRRTVAVGEWRISLPLQQKAMGIDWMGVTELSQAIPPAYTELIGHQLMQHVKAKAVA